MKRILVLLSVVLFSAGNLYAQKDKQVESNLMFNSGTFFETGSYYGNINWSELFSSQRTFRPTYLLLPGHVFRISYGLDVKMNEHWSLMPGVGARVQTASLLGMFAIGGDVDVMAARNSVPKFYRFDYGIQPSVTFRMGKHWQWGLEANFGLRNMRIPYELEYQHHVPGSCLVDVYTAKVSGTTHLHTVALTCGFHF